jgi:hypothetical protein
MWVYVIFNIFAALFLYWLTRVPKVKKEKAEENAAVAPAQDPIDSDLEADREAEAVEHEEKKSAGTYEPMHGGQTEAQDTGRAEKA